VKVQLRDDLVADDLGGVEGVDAVSTKSDEGGEEVEVLGHRDGGQQLFADQRIAGLVALRAQQLGEGLGVSAVEKPRERAGEVNDRIEFVDRWSHDQFHRGGLFLGSLQRR